MRNTKWQPASYGTGKRHWYVVREREVALDARGNYRRFASLASAAKAAAQLNEEACHA